MVRWSSVAVALILGLASPTLSRAAEAVKPPRASLDLVFKQWLDAFNSGDPSRIKAFYVALTDDPNPVFELEAPPTVVA